MPNGVRMCVCCRLLLRWNFVEATSCCFFLRIHTICRWQNMSLCHTASAGKWSTVTRYNWFISLCDLPSSHLYALHHTAAVACCFVWFCESAVSSGFGCSSAHILRIQKISLQFGSVDQQTMHGEMRKKNQKDANYETYEGAKSSNELISIINSLHFFCQSSAINDHCCWTVAIVSTAIINVMYQLNSSTKSHLQTEALNRVQLKFHQKKKCHRSNVRLRISMF